MKSLILIAGLLALTLAPVAAEDNPTDQFPEAIGYSFSDLTGNGFTYRVMNSHWGWQVSGVATSQNFLNYDHPTLYSLGTAYQSVLYSYDPVEWFFGQFYWLGGLSWKAESTRHDKYDEDGWTFIDTTYTWASVVTVGPGLGLELGLLEHFSLSLEAGYKVSYDVAESNPGKALALTPGFSAVGLFRF